MFQKIKNFDNAVEILLLKTLFYKLWSLIISNWKITYDCCFPTFLGEVFVNYASNMIRIRLNNCTIFWKQREFLHGLDNLQKLVSVGAIRRFIFSFFANQNFSRDRKAVLLRKWIAVILQVKFCFMGCQVKANPLVSGNRQHRRYHHS